MATVRSHVLACAFACAALACGGSTAHDAEEPAAPAASTSTACPGPEAYAGTPFECPFEPCATASELDGAWACDAETALDVDEGVIRYCDEGGEPTGIGCMACDGSWVAVSVPRGEWVNVDGSLSSDGALAWQWCAGDDLEGCVGSPSGTGSKSCARR
ncbi:MAG TPA: hypothetical protein RMH99_29860 [Sandaracinaceae bacterium LLY-WYZ-13_1]|nr:hypothetical protein [Sandaracinaceae bacterium LLY-WYZ-13_1]